MCVCVCVYLNINCSVFAVGFCCGGHKDGQGGPRAGCGS
jgi:hypothetical protein